MRALTQQVLDLRREIEGQRGELGVQRARHREGVARAVEKIRIAEGHVRGAGRHLLADVGQHDLGRDDEEAPPVDGRDRAVAAAVLAAAAGLHVADEVRRALAVEVRVLLQRGQRGPRRHGEVEPGEAHARALIGKPPRQRDERVLQLAGQHRVGVAL